MKWDTRGAFPGPALEIPCINISNLSTHSSLLFFCFDISRENHKIMMDFFFFMKVPALYYNTVTATTASFTSLFGGNLVDGPPVFSYGIKRDFSILFLRFRLDGKFILAIIIFGWFFIYINWVP